MSDDNRRVEAIMEGLLGDYREHTTPTADQIARGAQHLAAVQAVSAASSFGLKSWVALLGVAAAVVAVVWARSPATSTSKPPEAVQAPYAAGTDAPAHPLDAAPHLAATAAESNTPAQPPQPTPPPDASGSTGSPPPTANPPAIAHATDPAPPPRGPAPKPTRRAEAEDSLAEEVRLLDTAQTALREDRLEAADRALDRYRRRFGKRGVMQAEFRALAVLQKCARGVATAADIARKHLAEHPDGVLTDRIRATCLP